MAPRSAAASVGLSPAAPVIAPITQSAGRWAASTSAALAGARLDAGAGERILELAIGRGSPTAAKRAPSSRASAASAAALRLALTASTR